MIIQQLQWKKRERTLSKFDLLWIFSFIVKIIGAGSKIFNTQLQFWKSRADGTRMSESDSSLRVEKIQNTEDYFQILQLYCKLKAIKTELGAPVRNGWYWHYILFDKSDDKNLKDSNSTPDRLFNAVFITK